MVNLVKLGAQIETTGAPRATQETDRYRKSTLQAAAATDLLENENRQLSATQRNTAKTSLQLATALDRTGRGARGTNFVLQNTAFQLQDIFTQVTLGVPVMRTLGIQLPQLLGGFGAMGAVIGVAVSALAIFTTGTKEAELSLEGLGDNLEESVSRLESFASRANQSTKVLSEDFGSLASQIRETFSFLTEITLAQTLSVFTTSSTEFSRSVSNIAADVDMVTESTRELAEALMLTDDVALNMVQEELDALASSVGVGIDTALALDDAFEALGEAKSLEEINKAAQDLTSLFSQAVTETDDLSDELLSAASGAGQLAVQAARALAVLERMANTSRGIVIGSNVVAPRGGRGSVIEDAGDRALRELGGIFISGSRTSSGSSRTGSGPTSANLLRENAAELFRQIEDGSITLLEAAFAQDEYKKTISQTTPEMMALEETFADFNELTSTIESELLSAFDAVAKGTKTLGEALLDFADNILSKVAQDLFAEQFAGPIASGIGGFLTGMMEPSAKGNVFAGGSITPFANGGVVSSPSIFPMKSGLGLMGEAGPEAILPLQRGSDGRLGVSAASGGSQVNVTVINENKDIQTDVQQTGPNDIRIISKLVAADIQQGGPVFQSISRTFDSRPKLAGR